MGERRTVFLNTAGGELILMVFSSVVVWDTGDTFYMGHVLGQSSETSSGEVVGESSGGTFWGIVMG